MYKLKRRKLLLLVVGVAWAWFYLYRGRGGPTPSPGLQEGPAVCGQTDRLNISSPRIIFGRHQPLACKFFTVFSLLISGVHCTVMDQISKKTPNLICRLFLKLTSKGTVLGGRCLSVEAPDPVSPPPVTYCMNT